jgi:hypothetical protein
LVIPVWAAAVLVSVVSLGGGFAAWHYLRRRPTPEEIERLRRLTIHREGKLGDGEILDVEGASIVFSYSVAGVVYTTSQDTTNLEERLPPDRMSMVGPVSVKFNPRNPANSIVLCEEWSGLRKR